MNVDMRICGYSLYIQVTIRTCYYVQPPDADSNMYVQICVFSHG